MKWVLQLITDKPLSGLSTSRTSCPRTPTIHANKAAQASWLRAHTCFGNWNQVAPSRTILYSQGKA